MLEERKQRVLRAVTDDYIETAEPVGSRTVARKYMPEVSPATIRNEMADLEEQGYLEQPHTSAGRVPSDRGYRYYVEVLLAPGEDSPGEYRQAMAGVRDIDTLVHRAGRALSRRTRYSSLVLKPSPHRLTVRRVRYAPVDQDHVLLVVMAEPGFVFNRLVPWVDAETQAEVFERLSAAISYTLVGLSPSQLGRAVFERIADEVPWPHVREQAVSSLMDLLGSYREEAERAYVDGVTYFLEQPEFRDVEYARQVLDCLEQSDALMAVMMGGDLDHLEVVIGREQPVPELRRCSVVLAPYGPGDRPMGVIGVIGPTRMDYRRAITAVQSAARALADSIRELSPA